MVKHRIDMYRFKWELDNIKLKNVPENCTLFYGSSTFAHWVKIEDDFKDFNARNAGFGGSTSDEALYHYNDIVHKFKPNILVWYFGDNEPVCGYSVKETTIMFKEMFERFHKDYPNSFIIVLGTKSSFARKEYYDYVIKLNKWSKKFCHDHYYAEYCDVEDVWWNGNDYNYDNFCDDKLHYNDRGNNLIKDKIIKIINSKRNLTIDPVEFEEDTQNQYSKKKEEMVYVSLGYLVITLTSLFVSGNVYWPYLLLNIVLSVLFVFYFIYNFRNTLYALKQKRKILNLMRNSDPSKEYLYFKDMQVDYYYEGIQVMLLRFENKSKEERFIYCLNDYAIYLEVDKYYEVESLNNFIIGVHSKNEG